MKKILLVLIILILLFSSIMVVNGPEDKENKNENNNIEVTPTPNIDDIDVDLVIYDNENNFVVDNNTNFNPLGNVEISTGGLKHQRNVNVNTFEVTENNTSFIFKQTGLLLIPNVNYTFSFNLSTPQVGYVALVNYDNGKTIASKNFNSDHVSLSFSINEISYSSAIEIYFDNLPTQTFDLSDLEFKTNQTNIKVNQVGYLPNEEKKAIFSYYDGDYFKVYNDNDEVVYVGNIVNKINDDNSKEIVGYGDFSTLKDEGKYYIESQYGNSSYVFEIKEHIYDDLFNDAFKMISSQRCGHELSADLYGSMAHHQCHNSPIKSYEYDYEFNVLGGWHDAGDYGRYTNTIEKTLIDLMLVYMNGSIINDEAMIVESGNDVNDVLDEIRVGLDYLIQVQLNDGSLYSKISSKVFADIVLPEDDNNDLYALGINTSVTAFASGIFKIASDLYEDIDPDFSNLLDERAELAYQFVTNNGLIISNDPEGYASGSYKDQEDTTERYFMNMAFYYSTLDEKYLDQALSYQFESLGLDYLNPSAYGTYLYLVSDTEKNNQYNIIANNFIGYADNLLNNGNNDPYYVTIGSNYYWGSNYNIANNAIFMMMAYKINHNIEYLNQSFDSLHYILGRNPINKSYVSGYGDNYPKNIHHRVTMLKDNIFKGAMVGGANVHREDGISQPGYDQNTPRSKCYLDNENSYSSNEVTIYYNSSLLLLLDLMLF